MRKAVIERLVTFVSWSCVVPPGESLADNCFADDANERQGR